MNHYFGSQNSILIIQSCKITELLSALSLVDRFLALFYVYITPSKYSGAGRILESYVNSRIRLVCITVLNPPNLVFR